MAGLAQRGWLPPPRVCLVGWQKWMRDGGQFFVGRCSQVFCLANSSRRTPVTGVLSPGWRSW
jgi:hypothetical protein